VKSLPLKNPSFRYLEKSFKEWLDVQGYAPSTVYNLPNHIREFLHYIETLGTSQIKDLKTSHVKDYYHGLKERSNQRRGGGLSNGHLNKHIQALRKFMDYLRKVGRLELPEITLTNEEASHRLEYLTEEEISLLFKATYRPAEEARFKASTEAIQSRDRAMLSVFYGCGLRRTEGTSLDVGDVHFDRSLLHVRKGKNHKERLVPISRSSLKYLTEYIYDHRPSLVLGAKTDALFITYTSAKRLQSQSLMIRLKRLQYLTGNNDLIEKEVGLHTLRHSIATHLLHHGMKLESISKFLGHSSLESTQIYVHLLSEDETIKEPISWRDKQPFANIPSCDLSNTIRLQEDESR
jgi:integrase/recombinase XerD